MYIEFCAHTDTTGAGHVWLSPIDVVLDRDRALVVQPDVIVVMNDRRHIVTDRVWGAPDLVIEVLSPHPRIGHLEERLEWFAQYGVRECWTVLQGVRQIEVIFVCERPDRAPANVAPPECIRSEVLPTLDVTPGEIMPSG